MADATYPTNPALSQVTNETEVNPTNWNLIQANINAIGTDLVDARGDDQAFPGTDHTPGQSEDLDDALQAIRHIQTHLGKGANWYTLPPKFIEIHPEFEHGVWTTSKHGAGASSNNTGTQSTGVDVVSNVERHYYEFSSSEVALQDYYVAVRITLPNDFNAWKEGTCLTFEYKTEDASVLNNSIRLYFFQSGSATEASGTAQKNTSWTSYTRTAINLNANWAWVAGDVLELYFWLQSKDDNYARLGKIKLEYTS